MVYTPLNAAYKHFLVVTVCLCVSLSALAQKNYIKGTVVDTAEKKKLQYAIVALIDLKDSTLYKSIRSSEDGSFSLNTITPGKYRLMISYPRMAYFLEEINVNADAKKDVGNIPMILEATLLADVVVKYVPPIRMRGDTLEYTADSFKVREGANVQELLKRLPGIQVSRNGTITAQGKEVKKVLVDGDEFFSDDPGLASQFLKANAVDKVQVFDKKSEAADFTGIDDGQRTKTINLKLKADKKNGYFGRLSAAADASSYHDYQAMGAKFSGPEKMSVFGMATKAGAGMPSIGEISKYVAQDYEIIEDGTMGFFGGISYNSGNAEIYDYSGGAGIPSVLYGGGHYSNKWQNDHEKLFANYRAKSTDVHGWSWNKNTNILPGDTSFTNTSNSQNNATSQQQRGSSSFLAPIDSFSTIKFSVNGNWQNSNRLDTTYSDSKNEKGIFVNNSSSSVRNANNARNFSSNATYEKKFRKKGRTLSASLQQDDNQSTANMYNFAANTYFDPATGNFMRTDTLNQLQQQTGNAKSAGMQLRYSDKFTDHFSVSVSYGFKWSDAKSIFTTYNQSNGKYDSKVDSLSTNYDFVLNTHIADANLAWNWQKLRLTIGGKVFFTGFKQENYDSGSLMRRHFINYAPALNLTFSPKQSQNYFFSYHGQTIQPSIDQLQPLHKSNNPLYVQIGNSMLSPALRHDLQFSIFSFNFLTGTNLNANASASYTQNAITSQSYVDGNNRTVSQYINLSSLPSFNGSLTYGWDYKKLHLRPSIGIYGSKYSNYSLLNGVKNKADNVSGGVSLRLNYKWKELMEIEAQSECHYTVGTTSINNIINRTFSHNHHIEVSYYLPKETEFHTDAELSFQPKNTSFNTSYNTCFWNASLVKKVLKNNAGAIKLTINNILNDNPGYRRSVWGGNTSEGDYLTIRRYWLIGFTWDFSKNTK